MTADFEFRTKAETLADLAPLLTKAQVPELLHFTLEEWAGEREPLLDRISDTFGERLVVVRSSAMAEDSEDSSMAGQFDSILSVDPGDKSGLAQAIDQVAASLPGDRRDRILVQEMARNMVASGVIMTFDVSRGAPYYSIEFDDETGRTDVVTSGSGSHKSLYVFRGAPREYVKSDRVRAFLDLAEELEKLTNSAAIDIEFGLDRDNRLHLFQVRRIVLARNWHPVSQRRVGRQLRHLEEFLEARSLPHDGLLGARTTLAVMPDWNPAEIIGTTPRPLAASLYRLLVTDGTWAKARAVMGYRDCGESDLMVLMGHQPYIDVRRSFNSFLPAGLPDEIGEKLVNAWLDRLEEHPEFHDKVEFEIVPTCVDFTFASDFADRYQGLLDHAEARDYADHLTELTRAALAPGDDNSLQTALATSAEMEALDFGPLSNDAPFSHLDRARSLLTRCRNMGTLSFAVAARHGFIAETLLRSAVRRGAISSDRIDAFKRTIHTVSGGMLEDFRKLSEGSMPRADFFARYGHLRPGTYEITSLRYDERGDDLFKDSIDTAAMVAATAFELSDEEREAIDALLAETRLDVLDADGLFAYARLAIASRENIKFAFTRLLSDALSHILNWGYPHALSRDDLSNISWHDIAQSLSIPVLDDMDRHYLSIAEENRRSMDAAKTLKFAHIITRPRDVYVATLNRSVPNFIGMGAASGRVAALAANASSATKLDGCVVCIENADPGFDWIFTKGLVALVTRFGGTNSHMAVRCAELGIPAAIGCGDQIFERIARAGSAEVNCRERYLRPAHV